MPDDLQLRRRLPPRDQHHPSDPRGLLGDRGAAGLSAPDGPGEQPGAVPGGQQALWDEPAPAIGSGPRRLIIRTDGAARGNPGPASAGAVLIDASQPGAWRPDATPIASISDYLGVQTNNVAEYTALVRALALARELGAEEVDLLLDSMLIVEQLHGRWRVKDAKLQPLHAQARRHLATFRRWTAVHVPRAENRAADALANEAIDRVRAGGPVSVVRRP